MLGGIGNDLEKRSVDAVAASLQLQFDVAKTKAKHVKVASVPLRPSRSPEVQERIRLFNLQMEQLCSNAGVEHINLDPEFHTVSGRINEGYFYDRLHLNPVGVDCCRTARDRVVSERTRCEHFSHERRDGPRPD